LPRSRPGLAFAPSVLASAASCVSPEELRREDEATCASYGFYTGTDAFVSCLQRESLALKGDLVLQDDGPNCAEAAEGHFPEALDRARRQGALSWELRTATSLSRLWHNQGRRKKPIGCSRRSMIGSPRGLQRPILEQRRR
jgi:hypothetical protein